ncbi:carboxypeptidase-like regulatory domain-containing protein [Sunxiuqinia elliptica]|uniref:Carboxypeptidase regulatory-like domain-containing protein n=1 Tax=Sunxiuqinia elliptica TaxID=655355 RepID=A0A4V3BZ97_9BACT|nr:carboxypeptidase-like regulatory domain-containing protein [Sunxiuqinia elliptica]TDO05669.1 hypothetical protein DET52_1011033 [Sunxiuqinia elliptica]TDO65211.1 hypothetical protein DET65_1591 [Sunxiuqinia elliptica]
MTDMKRISFLLIILAFIFSSCEKDDATLYGNVYATLEGEQTAISESTVRIYSVKLADDGVIQGGSNLTPIAETTTNAEGYYSFNDLPEANYWITAVATVNGEKYGTNPHAPVGVYLPSGQSEKKDIIISELTNN